MERIFGISVILLVLTQNMTVISQNISTTTATPNNHTVEVGDALQETYGSIVYAAVIFRHGDRTPVATYPTDPHKDYPWPQGWGQLTNAGKQRLHKLGRYFKTRYSALTGNAYDPKKTVMFSSDVDRCLMSGLCFYSGYYPPAGNDVWNESIAWQPIPVHTTTCKNDNIVVMARACPRYTKLSTEFYKSSQQIKNWCERNKGLYEHVGKNAGVDLLPCGSEENYLKLAIIHDTLMVERQFNLTLPAWTSEVFPGPLTSAIAEGSVIQLTDNRIKRLKAGPLLQVLTSDMNQTIHNSTQTPKLHLFSGHDGTILTLMRALDIYNNISPPYGAALALELRRKSDNYYVTVLYKNTTDAEPYTMNMPKCTNPCSLQTFLNFTNPLVPQNWEAECTS